MSNSIENNIITSHVCLSECMPEIMLKVYKDMGVKINSEELSSNVKEVFTKNIQGQNPVQCLILLLFMLREVYCQVQNTEINEKELSNGFLNLVKQKEISMYV